MKAKALTAALIFLAATTTLARAETTNFSLSGSAAGFEAVVEDTTPDAFSFAAKMDVEPNTLVQADEVVTVAGLGDGVVVPITVSGTGSPGFRINGGSLQDANSQATVKNGDRVEISLMTAADAWETAYAATLTIGTLSGTFNVTTREAPAANNYQISAGIHPKAASITGFASPSYTSFSYGAISVNEGVQVLSLATNSGGYFFLVTAGNTIEELAGKKISCNNGISININNASTAVLTGGGSQTYYDWSGYAGPYFVGGQSYTCNIQ